MDKRQSVSGDIPKRDASERREAGHEARRHAKKKKDDVVTRIEMNNA